MQTTFSENVRVFLSAPLKHFINGSFQASPESTINSVVNPATGKDIVAIAYGSASDVDAAAQAAQTASKTWGAMTSVERSILMHRFADKLEAEAKNIAFLEALDVGKPFDGTEADEIPFGIECARYYADLALNAEYSKPLALKNMDARVNRTPYGVCGFIFPWNFPYLLFMWNVMPAIAAGNTVVVKPSEVTPLSSLYITKLAKEAGIPDGVINIVIGDGKVGSSIVEHSLIKRMSFTGSTEVGKVVAESCAARLIPCKLELGGKGAAVVFNDCDLEHTAKGLAGAITGNTGQVCCTATRWFVHADIYDAFKEKVISILKDTHIGADAHADMGPLVSKVQQDRVLSYYDKGLSEGASAALSGAKMMGDKEDGYFVSPCLMEGDIDNVCFKEEIFGPTAFLIKFTDEESVINQVNSVQYGLANSVWSEDEARCQRVAEKMVAGNSWINAHNVFAYGLPYAGVNLSGIGGGVNSAETFYDYLRDQTIARPLS